MDSKGKRSAKRAQAASQDALEDDKTPPTEEEIVKMTEALCTCRTFLTARSKGREDKDIKMVVVKQGDGFVFTFWSQKDGALLVTKRV